MAAAADGDFVVVWRGLGYGPGLIQGQRYASDGWPQGAEFQVNTFTTNSQYAPSVAAAATGTSSWCGPSGATASTTPCEASASPPTDDQGAEFQVGTLGGSRSFPFRGSGPQRRFVVVWDGNAASDPIRGRRYAFGRVDSDPEFQILRSGL